jgi:RND family efflux transporter MFP subunit
MSKTAESKHDEAAGAASSEMASETSRTRLRRAGRMIVIAIVAVAATAGSVLLWRQWTRPGGAGQPVPAPRAITFDQSSASETATPMAEATLTLAPEMAARAGLRIESVGEQLAADGGETATGVVQPNAYRTTPVISLVGGRLRSVRAELGQQVEQGQTLAVVFSEELAAAQSRYLTALAELDEHHKHHRRTEQLVELGAASREEFEQATTKLKTAEAEVASLGQRLLFLGLSAQQASALRSPSQVQSEVSLPSPVSGMVINRSVNPGEVIEANKELLRVADLSSVWIIAQVYEKDLPHVRVGSQASLTAAAYPGRVFRGRVAYLDPSFNPATRTAQVRIEAANRGQTLKLGMFVNVSFASARGAKPMVAVVPVAAVQQIGHQQVVFVATKEAHVFAMRPVRLGPETNGLYPVLEGLSAGERIVTGGSFLLRAEWLKLHPSGT